MLFKRRAGRSCIAPLALSLLFSASASGQTLPDVPLVAREVPPGANPDRRMPEKPNLPGTTISSTLGTTIQVEVGGCEPNDMFCVMKVAGGAAEKAHDHTSHQGDHDH